MKVKVLIEGYAKKVNGEVFASCSTTLIEDGNKKIIVDPGANRDLLLEKLSKEGLGVEDINIVMLTHTHLDHSLLTGMFMNAEVYDDGCIYGMNGGSVEHERIIGKNIEIIPTPGHDQFHMSVLVKNSDKGNIVIAGDVFWWLDSEEQKTDKQNLLDKIDPYVKDEGQLLKSREELIKLADYIIPGHGKPFYLE